MQTLYGEGESRRLRPGEEATIIKTIEDLITSLLEVHSIPQISFTGIIAYD